MSKHAPQSVPHLFNEIFGVCAVLVALLNLIPSTAQAAAQIEYTAIPVFDQPQYAEAYDINIKGQMVGTYPDYQAETTRGYFWSQQTGVIFLPDPGNGSKPTAINNLSYIVGYVIDGSNNIKAALWDPNALFHNIGAGLEQNESVLCDINDNNTAVGWVEHEDPQRCQMFLLHPDGQIQMLNIYDEHRIFQIYILDTFINSANQVTGSIQDAGQTDSNAFFWDPQTGLQFLKMPENAEYIQIVQLNDDGRIIGNVRFSDSPTLAAYQWTTPTTPQPLFSYPITGLNQHGQHSNSNGFYDGQFYFSERYAYNLPNTLPQRLLYSFEEGYDYEYSYNMSFSFSRLQNNGYMIGLAFEPRTPFCFQPTRITFEDPNLVQAIALQLGMDHDPNYFDVLEMKSLNANTCNISSLNGLEYAFNLEYLDVRKNPLDKRSYCYTIEFLQQRNPNMTILYDSSPYSDCALEFADSALKQAVESRMAISDPTFLDIMQYGNRLSYLSAANIQDLSGLEQTLFVRDLTLPDATFSETGSIGKLKTLMNLEITNNKNLKNINSLTQLKCLEKLNLEQSGLEDIRPLLGIERLEEVNLIENPIDPIMVCEVLPALNALHEHGTIDIIYCCLPPSLYGCSANLGSLIQLRDEWLRPCEPPSHCDEVDFNQDGTVNLSDLYYIAVFWLKEEVYW